MIRIANVTKAYNENAKPAVNDLSFQVNSGEIFVFLGPNGAGKSTTIKMLVGILAQDRGTIEVAGFDNLTDSLEMKKRIGYVSDEPEFYEKMTAIRYLNFIDDLFEVPAEVRKIRIEKYARMFEIEDKLGNEISSYSHGMKQKLGIIAALSHDPEVLILDEPMVGLDPKSSFLLKEALRAFCNEGKTVFFSTHVMDTAERVCDRVAIINQGCLIAMGSFAQLKANSGEQNATLEKLFLELTDKEEMPR
ncbi:MAG: ABC transporter ATP-binding protein [Sphaerochaetaceae bacterium]|nr:ABC transporter ATP-binding protein [Sphaerochaetaceae bacterium]